MTQQHQNWPGTGWEPLHLNIEVEREAEAAQKHDRAAEAEQILWRLLQWYLLDHGIIRQRMDRCLLEGPVASQIRCISSEEVQNAAFRS